MESESENGEEIASGNPEDSPGQCMWFRTLTRGLIQVPYSPTDTVLTIKQKVHSLLGDKFASENVDFIFQGNVFQNEEPIVKYKVPADAFVVLLANDPDDVNPDLPRVLQIIKEREQAAAKITEKVQTDK